MCDYSILYFHRIVEFNVLFSNRGGGILDSFDEGLEFGFQNLNQGIEWVPLMFYSFQNTGKRDDDIKIGSELIFGDNTVVIIRGHNVSFSLVRDHRAELKLCGREIICNNASLSFRWLQTVISSSTVNADPVYLDNVKIRLRINSSEEHVLFKDDFNSGTMIKYKLSN